MRHPNSVVTTNLGSTITLCTAPATAYVVVSRKADGSLEIDCTGELEESIQLLDEAMEEMDDGQRLPPDSK